MSTLQIEIIVNMMPLKRRASAALNINLKQSHQVAPRASKKKVCIVLSRLPFRNSYFNFVKLKANRKK